MTMARERVITRTINVTECEVMLVNPTTKEIITETHYLTGVHTTDSAMKELKDYMTHTELIPVTLTIKDVTEHLYSMRENDFIKFAKEIPLRKHKTE